MASATLIRTDRPAASSASRRPVATPSRTPPGSGFRTDIQGLRALAVSLVLLYHLMPERLTGGFVGVDVFFVISGFLITSHLYANPPRRLVDLLGFWSRRVRRLLPASLLVLATTVIATRLVAPATQWVDTAQQVIAAALYAENWRLAATSVDYLAAGQTPSPVQHFWSLSVEEQFYVGWPILLLVAVAVAARTGWSRRITVAAGLLAVVAWSFVTSVQTTAAEPAGAYFITTTRVWELGLGGLLALLATRWSRPDVLRGASRQPADLPGWPGRLPVGGRSLLAWTGLVLVAAAAFTYTPRTPFPGWRALLPVLGTVLVIAAANPQHPSSPRRFLALRGVQGLGNISYSVYLWHWPLIVLAPYASGEPLSGLDKLGVALAAVTLGWFSTTFVENRFRASRRPPALVLRTAATGMVAVVVLGSGLLAESQVKALVAQHRLEQTVRAPDTCFGAAALAPGSGCPTTTAGRLVPSPAVAAQDRTEAYDATCSEPPPFAGMRSCVFGDPQGTVSVALVGNSHATQWLPALAPLAAERGWRITTFLSLECPVSTTALVWDARVKQTGCTDWANRVLATTTTGHFDLVITSERNKRAAEGRTWAASYPQWLSGYRAALKRWTRTGTDVLVLRDTPTPAMTLDSVPECLAEHPDDLLSCAGPRSVWVPRDPLVQAAKESGNAHVSTADLTDYLCRDTSCPAAVGGVPVYLDASHLTRTYARTLTPYLAPHVERAVQRARG